jgi:hypothetical protein
MLSEGIIIIMIIIMSTLSKVTTIALNWLRWRCGAILILPERFLLFKGSSGRSWILPYATQGGLYAIICNPITSITLFQNDGRSNLR